MASGTARGRPGVLPGGHGARGEPPRDLVQSAWVGGGHDGRGVSGEPLGFVLEGWDVSELAVEAGGVVPVDPLDGGELGALAGAPFSSQSYESPTEGIDAAIPASASRSL